jgi:hypothetical protein
MSIKLRLPILLAAVLVLAAAVFVAVSLALSPGQALSALTGQRRDFTLIPATELPPTQADLFGSVIEVRDNSIMLRPITKSAGDQNSPPVEVVVTANTKVFMDTTSDRTGTIIDGKLQQTLEPFDINNIVATDTVVAWGSRRGDRLAAEVVVDERNHWRYPPPTPTS